ncbi:MAG: protein kinase [Myxococcales bacterium]|jgi:serine/threonine-protein kinase
MSSQQQGDSDDSMLGRVLLGRYRIVRELAKGGMGVVYLARAEGAVGFVKPVVIKLVLQEFATDERYVRMFAREAQILAHLRHPSIVDVIEFGEDRGNYVMVLEYVRGYHLGQWKRYLKRNGREIPTDIILQITIDILEALHHAHGARHPDGESMHIVHRDVSPSNVLLDSDGRGRLLDFGVARMRGGTHGYKTQVQGFVGKYPYIAPEIFAGNEATPLSDLYSCAVVLHETILGHNVFRGENQAATLHRVMHHDPEPVSAMREDVPEELDDVLARALAKDPAQRYQSAAELAGALRALQPHPEHEVRARLAELLAEDFGEEMAQMLGLESLTARDEAWRRLSLLPERRASDAPADPLPTQAGTRPRSGDSRSGVVVREHTAPAIVAPPPAGQTPAPHTPPSDAGQPADSPAPFTPAPHMPPAVGHAPPTAPQAQPAPASNRLLIVGLVLVAALATTAILLVVQRGAPRTAATQPRFRVVQQAAPEPEPKPVAEPRPEPQPTAEPRPEPQPTAEPEPEAPAREPRKPPPRAKRGPDARPLTAAFRRKQPQLERCFERHASGQDLPRVQVKFSIAADGTVRETTVQPASVRTQPVGACIDRVARSTSFPGQGQPLVFTIPVTTRRVAR